ncbi:T9SS type A sorting domain-containing protein [Hymenobacter crusticola]
MHLEAQAPQLLVYPTQVTDQTLRYSFTAPLGAEALLAVYNSTGQVVLREHGPQLAGGELRLPNLPMGWYVVQLLVNHKSYSARFYRP